MKRILLSFVLLCAAQAARAADSIVGDLFSYENYAATFTKVIDAGKLDRLSLQVSYSNVPVVDIPFTVNNVDTLNDTISATSHGLATAQRVQLASAPAGAPLPLTTGTTYFVIKISDNLIQLATTYALAIAGTKLDITAATPSTGTWTLRVLPFVGNTANYLWDASNDGANWVTVGSVGSSVTGSTRAVADATSTVSTRIFDWGEFAYRFLRFTFNGPADGAIKLRAYLNAKTRS